MEHNIGPIVFRMQEPEQWSKQFSAHFPIIFPSFLHPILETLPIGSHVRKEVPKEITTRSWGAEPSEEVPSSGQMDKWFGLSFYDTWLSWLTAWWFGTWMDYDFPFINLYPFIGNVIIPTDELFHIFQRGRYTTNQDTIWVWTWTWIWIWTWYIYIYMIWYWYDWCDVMWCDVVNDKWWIIDRR